MRSASLKSSLFAKGLAFAVLAAVLAGCSTGWSSSASSPSTDKQPGSGPQTQISGVALPEGYSLDANRTIILGEGDRWIGRLSYTVNSSADAMFDFIRREMGNYGWTEVAVTRAEASQMTYLSNGGDRVAQILITRSTLYGSKIDMTVAPSTGNAVTTAPRTGSRR